MNKRSSNLRLIVSIVLIVIILYIFRAFIQIQVNNLTALIWKQKTILSKVELQTFEEQLYALRFKTTMLEKENAALRKQLEAPLPPELGLLPARVVGNSRFLFIDQGRQSGIKAGSVVISQEILVGIVFEVGEHTSKIRLLTDPDSKIPVKTHRGTLGLLQGGGNKLMLTRVLQADTLEIDDLVGTSGAEELPSGILIGTITQLIKVEVEVYQRAEISPSLDYNLLTHVFVVM